MKQVGLENFFKTTAVKTLIKNHKYECKYQVHM